MSEPLTVEKIDEVEKKGKQSADEISVWINHTMTDLITDWAQFGRDRILGYTLAHYMWLMNGKPSELIVPEEITKDNPIGCPIPLGFKYSIYPDGAGRIVINFWVDEPKLAEEKKEVAS